jgi:mannose-6-phosphate isomerase-like protein (cupin superfamily)
VTDYAIVNLRKVEDSAPKFGLGETMQARFPREQLDADSVSVSLQRVAPNARQPFAHRHGEQEEIYVVVDGGGQVTLDEEPHELRPWDAVRVAPGVLRLFEAGPDGLEFLAFGTTTGGFDDVEAIPGG